MSNPLNERWKAVQRQLTALVARWSLPPPQNPSATPALPRWLEMHRLARYGLAVASVAAGYAAVELVGGLIPPGFVYWAFYAAVVVAATLGGFGPGMLATVLSAAVVAVWLLPSPTSTHDGAGLVLFVATSLFMSLLASLYRRAAVRLAENEWNLARQESDERFRAFFHNTAVGTAQLDLQGRFLLVNERYAQLTGYTRDELLGMNALDLVPPEDREQDRDLLARFVSGETAGYDVEKRYLRKDGRLVWVHLTRGRIRDASGRLLRLAGVLEDISARREAEDERHRLMRALEERDQRKNEFIAMLSHELRNPLAPIRNSIYILERAETGAQQAARARAVIDRQLQHLTRLVDDLLDLTRIARGKIRLHHDPLDLGELARRAAEDHREVFRRSGVELHVDLGEQPVPVTGDGTRLVQVIGNLLHNAAKFTPRGGRTWLSLAIEDAQAVLAVTDTGPGIPEEILGQLFEPFVQGERTLDRSRGGLGLGLNLVKSIVEMHGGSVQADSPGRGEGARFLVRLPLDRRAAAAPETAAPGVRSHGSRRVLVIEDNLDAAQSLKEALELGEHQVEVALAGPEGLAKAREFCPDVVVCDIGLPGMDGYAVARAIRADPSLRSTHLVALSGYALEDDVEKCRAAGFDRHMAKPPDPDLLQRTLAEAPARGV